MRDSITLDRLLDAIHPEMDAIPTFESDVLSTEKLLETTTNLIRESDSEDQDYYANPGDYQRILRTHGYGKPKIIRDPVGGPGVEHHYTHPSGHRVKLNYLDPNGLKLDSWDVTTRDGKSVGGVHYNEFRHYLKHLHKHGTNEDKYIRKSDYDDMFNPLDSKSEPKVLKLGRKNKSIEFDTHPGAVCSSCGRTVTEPEYSSGESKCCKADVTGEEHYESTESDLSYLLHDDIDPRIVAHKPHDGMCNLSDPVCKDYIDALGDAEKHSEDPQVTGRYSLLGYGKRKGRLSRKRMHGYNKNEESIDEYLPGEKGPAWKKSSNGEWIAFTSNQPGDDNCPSCGSPMHPTKDWIYQNVGGAERWKGRCPNCKTKMRLVQDSLLSDVERLLSEDHAPVFNRASLRGLSLRCWNCGSNKVFDKRYMKGVGGPERRTGRGTHICDSCGASGDESDFTDNPRFGRPKKTEDDSHIGRADFQRKVASSGSDLPKDRIKKGEKKCGKCGGVGEHFPGCSTQKTEDTLGEYGPGYYGPERRSEPTPHAYSGPERRGKKVVSSPDEYDTPEYWAKLRRDFLKPKDYAAIGKKIYSGAKESIDADVLHTGLSEEQHIRPGAGGHRHAQAP